jgi:hypothetical protein
VRIWWRFAFIFRVEDGKCKAVRRDVRGELITSSWAGMKQLLVDEWCERPVDAASWTDDEVLVTCSYLGANESRRGLPYRPAGAALGSRRDINTRNERKAGARQCHRRAPV